MAEVAATPLFGAALTLAVYALARPSTALRKYLAQPGVGQHGPHHRLAVGCQYPLCQLRPRRRADPVLPRAGSGCIGGAALSAAPRVMGPQRADPDRCPRGALASIASACGIAWLLGAAAK